MATDYASDVLIKFNEFLDEFALYDAIDQKNFKTFRSLISHEGFDINRCDRYGRSILLQLATISKCEKFAEELLQKGANLHLTDQFGRSFLHLAATAKKVNNLKTTKLLIEKGADVNHQDDTGLTPLYTACLEGNVNLIYLLLYYGADPNIASHQGLIPLDVLSPLLSKNEYNRILEMLFSYTFDDEECCISLPVLASAMWRDSPLFSKIADRIPRIKYNTDDINYFCKYLYDIKGDHFEVFVEKFEEVLQAVMDEVDLLFLVLELSETMDLKHTSKIVDSLLQSKHVSKLVQNSDSTQHYIHFLLSSFAARDTPENVQNRIFLLLSYGLGVTVQDLETVYSTYGYCNLFRTLLHMDITPPQEESAFPFSLAKLYYDPTLDVREEYSEVFQRMTSSEVKMLRVLDYFNDHELKQYALTNSLDADIVQKIRDMPEVSSLVELSRNMARMYIMDYYNARTCKKFFTVLNGLPIDWITKGILAYERKVY